MLYSTLLEDHNKNIWIATNNGVDIYNWNNNSFKPIAFIEGEDSLTNSFNNYSTFLLQAKNKNIFLSTNNYVYQYDSVGNVFVPLSIMQDFPEVKQVCGHSEYG
jgi:ligand-binding sensor domain-containing protein